MAKVEAHPHLRLGLIMGGEGFEGALAAATVDVEETERPSFIHSRTGRDAGQGRSDSAVEQVPDAARS